MNWRVRKEILRSLRFGDEVRFIGTVGLHYDQYYGPVGHKVRDVNCKQMLVHFPNTEVKDFMKEVSYYNLSCSTIDKAVDVVRLLDEGRKNPDDDLPF